MRNNIHFSHYVFHAVFLSTYGIVKYIPSPIGDLLRKLVLGIFGSNFLRARIYEGVTLWYPYKIKIGKGTSLNEWVYISGYGNVTIGEGVRIGHRSSILSSDHQLPRPGETFLNSGLVAKPVVIADNVFIGCNATILGGVTIGEGAVVAAGAVVTKDVPAKTVVGGVPGKLLSQY